MNIAEVSRTVDYLNERRRRRTAHECEYRIGLFADSNVSYSIVVFRNERESRVRASGRPEQETSQAMIKCNNDVRQTTQTERRNVRSSSSNTFDNEQMPMNLFTRSDLHCPNEFHV
jgi:hypothetical protein